MQRPVAVTVFGILNLLFAVIGAFSIISTAVLLALPNVPNNLIFKMMRENPTYSAWTKVSLSFGALACLVLLAAGIGLLKLQPWGRKLSIGYAIYAIVAALAGTAVNAMVLIPPVLQAGDHQGPEYAGMVGGAIGGTIGGCFGVVYPILLLIFMTRPKIVAAFAPAAAPALASS
jgi:hypothetical protein